ncbi:hypothetical protein V5799_014665, partial [Amblyomma americanum]
VQHQPPEHDPGPGGPGLWHQDRGCQHSLPVLWHVEDHFCMAHGRHGPLLHQLPALWGAQVVVLRAPGARPPAGAPGRRLLPQHGPGVFRLSPPQDDRHLAPDLAPVLHPVQQDHPGAWGIHDHLPIRVSCGLQPWLQLCRVHQLCPAPLGRVRQTGLS